MAESTTGKPTRIFMLVIAILFIFSASAFTVLVIYEAVTANHNSDSQANNDSSKKTLQGTKLQGFTPVASIKTLKIIDQKVGTGKVAKAGDTVTVDYTGALASNGVIFQSSKDTGAPVPLSLNNVIEGWKKGIPGMKVGGERRLLIPASMAYGAQGQPQGGIPPNADLVFDITLVKIGS